MEGTDTFEVRNAAAFRTRGRTSWTRTATWLRRIAEIVSIFAMFVSDLRCGTCYNRIMGNGHLIFAVAALVSFGVLAERIAVVENGAACPIVLTSFAETGE